MEIIDLLNKAIMAQDCKLRLERFQTDPAKNQHFAASSSRLFGISKEAKPDDAIDAIDQKVNEDPSDLIPNNSNP
jgi:hypothetical protein